MTKTELVRLFRNFCITVIGARDHSRRMKDECRQVMCQHHRDLNSIIGHAKIMREKLDEWLKRKQGIKDNNS